MSHTNGPWKIEVTPAMVGEPTQFAIKSGEKAIAFVFSKPNEANARLIAAAPDLLQELKLAQAIILNALQVMTSEQKFEFGRLNEHDGLKDGLAVTRHAAREAVIRKAEGREP